MTITNGYTTLATYKGYQRISSTDATDDSFIEQAIEAASRWIDRESQTNFYGASETHYFDCPLNNRNAAIMMDAGLISITSVTNGDGTTVTSAQYYLLPANSTPRYAIGLRNNSGISWQLSSGSPIQAITIVGTWGYSATAPADVALACLEIAKALYSRRFGENMNVRTVVTSSGVVQIPEGVPDWAADTISKYRRYGFA